jgi:radical SAM protein (TIGR01212 family)
MVKKLQKRHIKVVIHIINGLPYETKEDMLETVKYLNKLKINGIKIHMLHIVKNTELTNMYQEKPFHILTKEEYINIVCDELELLNENIIINRITGDPKTNDLIAPTWLIKKFSVLNDIDKEMVRRNSYQGIKKED